MTDADYKHAKRAWEDFGMQDLGNITTCLYKVIPCYWQTYSNAENKVLRHLLTRFYSFSFSTRIGVAAMFEENRSRVGITNRR